LFLILLEIPDMIFLFSGIILGKFLYGSNLLSKWEIDLFFSLEEDLLFSAV